MPRNLPSPWSFPKEARILHFTHYAQFVLAFVIFVLAITRIALRMQGVGVDRSNPNAGGGGASSWGTGVAVKSMIFIGYQILTERIPKFHRFASLKANMVLNILEAVFWIALVAITGGALGGCVAPMCAINGIILTIALVLFLIGLPVAYASIRHYIRYRQTGLGPTEEPSAPMNAQAGLPSYAKG